MFAQTCAEAEIPLRNERIASRLVILLALAPIATPSLVLIGVTTFRDLAAAKIRQEAPAAEARALNVIKFAKRVTPNDPADAPAIGEPTALIAGAAAIRSTAFERPLATLTNAGWSLAPTRTGASSEKLAAAATSNSTSWVMEHFTSVTVRDGLRLQAGAQTIALAGVQPPPAGSTCRRLDGLVESCSARADDRLEVLVRDRQINCQIFAGPNGQEMRGRCKAGDIDLAADLLRNGLARPG